ncbi:2-amino-4-hydroxy-6-hydroxymethyldihydropteridine diphosphokinase [Catenovulum sp. SX2]|uniref:2-amino-4-hydroxy-6- hydroxymethyldihydropteridine diphosphokinase n=1 Tax=Catenovulum sp. SX2 TaxID=3398614 RepID=UPI003F85D05E
MALVAISLGTNKQTEFHLKKAIFLLRPFINELKISPVYESEPVSFGGANFKNIVFGGETNLSLEQFVKLLKSIENQYGRDRSSNNKSEITLDLDLLFYGDSLCDQPIKLPRDEITKNAFVLLPLSDIFSDVHHPALKKTYGQLKAEYNNPQQKLWTVKFNWD